MGENRTFVTIVLPAELTADWLGEGTWLELEPGTRLFVDGSQVETAELTPSELAAAAIQAAARGIRAVVYAPGPLVFGLARQAFQLAGVHEGRQMAVFRERRAALAWLLEDSTGG